MPTALRYYLVSLIYDYWLDPFGNRVEHNTDTDLVNNEYEPIYFTGTAEETTQRGYVASAVLLRLTLPRRP